MDVRIRPWRPEDAAALARIIGDPQIQANLRDGLPCPYTAADGAAWIAQELAAAPGTQWSFAVEADGALAGSVGIFRGANIRRLTAELGYYVAQPLWGRGIASRAVPMAVRHVFAHSDIIRIYAEPFSDNAASCRVLEKCGFALEGVMRSNAVKNGAVRDMRLYALLRDGAGV